TALIDAAGPRPTIVDTSGPGLLEAAQAGAHVLKPNAQELREATGHHCPLEGAAELLSLGAEVIFVSQGEDGLLVVSAEGSLHARLPHPLHGNPTGAGDAVVAAIAASIHDAGPRTWDVRETLRRAVAWSAAAVLMPQAGEIAAEHKKFYQDVQIREGNS